ncbi:hypothetical protein D3C80_669220 [compost metagenome]
MQSEILEAPVTPLYRLQDRAQPGFLSIATQQAKRTIKVLTAGNSGFHAGVEFQLFDVRRHNIFDVSSEQLMAAVQHLFLEVAVDRFDPPLRVKLQDQHLAVQAALDLLNRQQLFAQLQVFFFQFAVEHQRSPGAKSVIRILLHRLMTRHS